MYVYGHTVTSFIYQEEEVKNSQDEVWKIFNAQPGRRKILPLLALQPDDQCGEKPQANNG